ncbi:MAG: potassium transporter [Firmicutes bacterium]|nr:potassium transporter [Bacillota bacterium]MCM1400864.1 potassium transporter [Bacteroides sp.]MCM1478040.1 potassium transporter [Bacteroides sp.]
MPTRKKNIVHRLEIALKRARRNLKGALERGTYSARRFGDFLMMIATLASLVCMIVVVIHAGYEHTKADYVTLHRLMRAIQWIFGANVLYNLTINLPNTLHTYRTLRWIVDIALLISLLPAIYPHPVHPWIPWLEKIMYSNIFLYAVLTAYSIITLSYAIFKIVDRRTNPSLLLSLSFLVFIVIGTFLLMLPKSTVNGISFIDAFFVSTSAVCVTGLTPVDVSATFTPLGIGILALLIQIGALGVMTFTSFFALFFSGSASIYSQLMLRDVIYSRSMNSLIPTLLYILAFTITLEAIGASLVFASIHGTLGMTVADEIKFSAFHSLSAFCNAGFSTLPDGMANPMLLGKNISIYWITTFLIVAGSIGFPILVNAKDAVIESVKRYVRRLFCKHASPYNCHQYNMNTKIVLCTFSLLFMAGSLMFFVLEYSNSLHGMSLWEKITQSVFNSAVPRSAGFSSVNPAGFLNVTLVMVLFLMWVGGGAQSTGGGIKVNTLAAIWLNLRAIVTGASQVSAFKRSIAVGSIRRANAVVAISIFSYFVLSFLLLGLEPKLPARSVLFEACSALFTVGSSLGITGELSTASKTILCVAMFLGRVGIISLLIGVAHNRTAAEVKYPSDHIIIN